MVVDSTSMMKYILVTGGVISGVGKGIVASSLGVILKAHGVRVSAIKIDPYINIDAGTFSPYEHGEVYVLDDGGEVDLDLGNYERFLGVRLRQRNNITTGKIYQLVIDRERRGDYLGKTVQTVPHITDAIKEWIDDVAIKCVDDSGQKPQVCIIELGGTTGDIECMPFMEALRQMSAKRRQENFLNVHVSMIIEPGSTGDQKTKPTQNSVKELSRLGLNADLLICRSRMPLQPKVRQKLSDSCNVPLDNVLNVPDVMSIYDVPIVLHSQGVTRSVEQQLGLLMTMGPLWSEWRNLAGRYDALEREVSIALVGKYVEFDDAYTSVVKALRHAAFAVNRKLKLLKVQAEDLEETAKRTTPDLYQAALNSLMVCDGILVPGGFGIRGIEGKIFAAGFARRNNKPYLGVCLGMQCAVVEFARDVLGWKGANSTEFNPNTPRRIVIDMPEHNQGQMGGSMRLGLRATVFRDEQQSIIRQLYGNAPSVSERHRHRYEVNPEYVDQIERQGLRFVGHGDPALNDEDKQRMEICELKDHPFFVGVQFHPEYLSHPLEPSPCYFGLLLASTGNLTHYLQHGSMPVEATIANGYHNTARASPVPCMRRNASSHNKFHGVSLLHQQPTIHSGDSGCSSKRSSHTNLYALSEQLSSSL